MEKIREFRNLEAFVKKLPVSKFQAHQRFESDCEYVRWGSKYLTVSTDALGEEMDLGLYTDPELWGWMTVMSSVSDLAATGSMPLGILINNQWKYKTSSQTKKKFFLGAEKALRKTHIGLLGGDSGNGLSHCHSATILGETDKLLTRKGIRHGDVLCLATSGNTGVGPALAFKYLQKSKSRVLQESDFRPAPDWKMAHAIKDFVHASMDTSDGIAASLQILMDINQVYFELHWDEKIFSAKALAYCRQQKIHPLMLLMGDLGDYQILFSIPEKNLDTALQRHSQLRLLGRAFTSKHNKKSSTGIFYNHQYISLPLKKITERAGDVKSIHRTMKELNRYFYTVDGGY